MPGRIHAAAQDTVALHVDAPNVFALDEDRAAVFRAHMEEHAPGGAVRLRGVAVHTVVVLLLKGVVVLINGVFVEVGKVAFVQSQLTIQFIGGLDESVGEKRIDGLCGHGPFPGRVLQPLPFVLCEDLHTQLPPAVVGEQTSPLGRVEAEFSRRFSFGHEGFSALPFDLHHDFIGRVVHLKIERGDVGWNHHITIVGEDRCLLRGGLRRVGHPHRRSTSGQGHHQKHASEHFRPRGTQSISLHKDLQDMDFDRRPVSSRRHLGSAVRRRRGCHNNNSTYTCRASVRARPRPCLCATARAVRGSCAHVR